MLVGGIAAELGVVLGAELGVVIFAEFVDVLVFD
jgi:hypothetical protein